MQAQYRQPAPYGHAGPQVPPQRTPQSNQRRGGMGSIMPQHPSNAMNRQGMPQPVPHAQQHEASDIAYAERARLRRSKKPTDKNLPDGVEQCVIDGSIADRYKQLRELERRLDVTITRKRLDMLETVNRETKRYRTMRIWISNTVEEQPWQNNHINTDTFDLSSSMDASFRVKIEGRLLDEDDAMPPTSAKQDNLANAEPSHPSSKQRFSSFFREMSVDFDRSRARAAADQAVTWSRPDGKTQTANHPSAPDFDEITFKRNGDDNTNILIHLHRFEVPDRFLLSPELADVADLREATQQEATLALWEYIRLMGLQEDEDKRNFRCDELLKKVVHKDVGTIPDLAAYIKPHLQPLPSISLPYTIRVDEEFHKNPQPTVYDVQVAIDDPLRAKALPLVTDPAHANILHEIQELDKDLSTLILAVTSSKAKHSFFSSLGDDPTTYIRNWLSSQKRDLEVILGEATRGGGEDAAGDEWRKGGRDGVWGTANAREAVNVMLTKMPR